ncbi:minor tail protein [Microbacterium phage Mabodamaca]|uniref:Minor tail protein n=1 Tax=Microbacterium phage Mabodamaca TaxID=3078574 RepID=A0AA96NHF3_9CAUD|nr:minor tail protein [Microbacterium phage Mabodamaca]
MNASELIVEVRDRDLIRRAQLTDVDMDSLVLVPRNNAVGSWQLTLPDTVLDETTGEWVPHAAAKALRQEGAGLIVTVPGADGYVTLLSGPMASAAFEATSDDLTGTWKFTGLSDTVLLADAVAFPDPASPDPAAQSAANDKRTGTAEALLRAYVGLNISATGAPAERVVGFRERLVLDGLSGERGPRLTKSPRFQNLLELCQEIGFAGGLSFDIVQEGDVLVFRIWEARDRSAFVRMDMANDLLKSVTYGYGSPSTTVALVAGQGQGEERTLVSRTSDDATASEATWGRRIERFYDQRNTDDLDELTQKGDEELLAGAASAEGLQAAPTDADAMLYPRDWAVGDIVGIVVEGQEVKAAVTEVAISVSGASVIMVATLGDASTFDPEAASQRRAQATSSRLSAIERTLEVPSAFELSDMAGDLPLSRTTGNLPLSRTTGNLDLPSRTSGDLPLSRTSGTLDLPSRTTGNLDLGSRVSGSLPFSRVQHVVGKSGTATRDAYYGVPTTDAARAALANSRPIWYNTDLGWQESYYAPVGTPGLTAPGLASGVEAGWYPTGLGPEIQVSGSVPIAATAGNGVPGWDTVQFTRGASWFLRTGFENGAWDGRYIRVLKAGRYDVTINETFTNGSGVANMWLAHWAAPGAPYRATQGYPVPLQASFYESRVMEFKSHPALAGEFFGEVCHSGSLAVHVGTDHAIRARFTVRYVGPLMAANT